MFDAELAGGWCMAATWRCTVAEAAGLWGVALFYATLVATTAIHTVAQQNAGTADRDSAATLYHTAQDGEPDACAVLAVVIYFFSLVGGCLLWVTVGVRAVHPAQVWQIQLIGTAMLLTCAALFVAVHLDMGANWSPEPEQKARHELVTHGVFRWARHPMYAVFIWASIGTLLATLNWLIAWCSVGLVFIALRRIKTEERILTGAFGDRYLEYSQQVPALGLPWCCLGFDGGPS